MSSLRMRGSNPNTVGFSNHPDLVEQGEVSHEYVTLPVLKYGVNKLFRGLWWTLVLIFAGLLVVGFFLPTLQRLDWDGEEIKDITENMEEISEPKRALEVFAQEEIITQPVNPEAFKGTQVGKVKSPISRTYYIHGVGSGPDALCSEPL